MDQSANWLNAMEDGEYEDLLNLALATQSEDVSQAMQELPEDFSPELALN